MEEVWLRLVGEDVFSHDITLLNPEKMERKLMHNNGMTQDEAHTIASKTYSYSKESTEEYD